MAKQRFLAYQGWNGNVVNAGLIGMRFGMLLALALVTMLGVRASAQTPDEVVWVQIEAQPSLARAAERARAYAAQIEDVNGFSLGRSWHGILLGPYRRSDAERVLQVYRAQRLIPSDSFITFTAQLRRQFWPVGVDVLGRGVLAAPQLLDGGTTTPPTPNIVAAPQEIAPPPPADETPAEARRSERALNVEERKALQVALKWAGFYNAAIDGSFGRGTRASMAGWQDANGFEATGVLTTVQRSALLAQYNAVLDGVGLELVRDDTAGIEMLIPQGVVTFKDYDYPFARFTPKGDIPAQVLMISQEGTQDTLYGLYDIMQTLEIVPLDGARERKRSSFELTGANERIVSHTEASLKDGKVKGFTLVWPAGDEARRLRVLEEMRKSFQRIDGALSPAQIDTAAQGIDLLAGLQIRRPRLSRSGFFVDGSGAVVTTLDAVQSCTHLTLDEETGATLAARDEALGLALLRPQTPLAPVQIATFSTAPQRLQGQVAVAGFSYGGVLGAPTMSFGTLTDLKGLSGEENLARMQLTTLDGDAGGPVFDETGGVTGMLLPRRTGGRQLPEDVSFAAKATGIRALLAQGGITPRESTSQNPMAAEDITVQARAMTVLVGCWAD